MAERKQNMIRRIGILVLLLVLALCLQASADTISGGTATISDYSNSLALGTQPTTTDPNGTWSGKTATATAPSSGWTSLAGIAKFDSTLGTLTNVAIEISTKAWGRFTYLTGSANNTTVKSVLIAGINVSKGGTSVATGSTAPSSLNVSNLAAVRASRYIELLKANAVASVATTNITTGLSNWIGTGNLTDLGFSTNLRKAYYAANLTYLSGTGWDSNGANGSVVVTYTYTPTPPPAVPEPSTIAGLLACLPAGILFMRKKRG